MNIIADLTVDINQLDSKLSKLNNKPVEVDEGIKCAHLSALETAASALGKEEQEVFKHLLTRVAFAVQQQQIQRGEVSLTPMRGVHRDVEPESASSKAQRNLDESFAAAAASSCAPKVDFVFGVTPPPDAHGLAHQDPYQVETDVDSTMPPSRKRFA
eukprot:103702-Karenia_brevis.AAC.1